MKNLFALVLFLLGSLALQGQPIPDEPGPSGHNNKICIGNHHHDSDDIPGDGGGIQENGYQPLCNPMHLPILAIGAVDGEVLEFKNNKGQVIESNTYNGKTGDVPGFDPWSLLPGNNRECNFDRQLVSIEVCLTNERGQGRISSVDGGVAISSVDNNNLSVCYTLDILLCCDSPGDDSDGDAKISTTDPTIANFNPTSTNNTSDPVHNNKICIGNHDAIGHGHDEIYIPLCNYLDEPLHVKFNEHRLYSQLSLSFYNSTGERIGNQSQQAFNSTFNSANTIPLDPMDLISEEERVAACFGEEREILVPITVCPTVKSLTQEAPEIHGATDVDEDNCSTVMVKFCCREGQEGTNGGKISSSDNTISSLNGDNLPLSQENSSTKVGSLDVVLYPNPAHDLITLQSKFESISIVNTAQQEVISISGDNKNQSSQINISELESGMYYVLINTKSGLKIKKLLKL